jgi:hypothetical protein
MFVPTYLKLQVQPVKANLSGIQSGISFVPGRE